MSGFAVDCDELAAKLPVLQDDNPILRAIAAPIADFEADTWSRLAKAMAQIVMSNKAFGLAAPQVGVSARLVVCYVDGRLLMMANPEIIMMRGEQRRPEGCLSVQHGMLRREVVRAKFVMVRYQDPGTGEWMRARAKDQMAACIQHELDHLDGVLFTDYGRIKGNTLPSAAEGVRSHVEGSQQSDPGRPSRGRSGAAEHAERDGGRELQFGYIGEVEGQAKPVKPRKSRNGAGAQPSASWPRSSASTPRRVVRHSYPAS